MRSGKRWFRDLKQDPAVMKLNKHGRENLLAVARVYSTHITRNTGLTRPGHRKVLEKTGLSPSTVKRWNRWLRDHGWLCTVVKGSTIRYRGGERPEARNEAAVYCLARPLPPAESPLSTASDQEKNKSEPPTMSARELLLADMDDPRSRKRDGRPVHGDHTERPPALRTGIFRRIPLHLLLRITRRFTDCGWTAADVCWAVDHAPDGTRHWHTTAVRNAAGWVTYRLAMWLASGSPLRSRSQILSDQAAAERARITERLNDPLHAAKSASARRIDAEREAASRMNPYRIPETSAADALDALKAQLGRNAKPASHWRDKAQEQLAEVRAARAAADREAWPAQAAA
jgi:hypothetical protein